MDEFNYPLNKRNGYDNSVVPKNVQLYYSFVTIVIRELRTKLESEDPKLKFDNQGRTFLGFMGYSYNSYPKITLETIRSQNLDSLLIK